MLIRRVVCQGCEQRDSHYQVDFLQHLRYSCIKVIINWTLILPEISLYQTRSLSSVHPFYLRFLLLWLLPYTVDELFHLKYLSKSLFIGYTILPETSIKGIIQWIPYLITCSAAILYADWSIGVRSGAVHIL